MRWLAESLIHAKAAFRQTLMIADTLAVVRSIEPFVRCTAWHSMYWLQIMRRCSHAFLKIHVLRLVNTAVVNI